MRIGLVLAAVALSFLVRAQAPSVEAASSERPRLSAAQLEATFAFGPATGQVDRDLILRAVAAADPQARRLIERIDGITRIDIGATPTGAAGVTRGAGDHFEIVLDLGGVYRQLGTRGVSRLVLHELGHVVDHALVPEAMRAELDAGIPPGLPCAAGTRQGSCAPRAERFAESFAKWAMNDIGVALYIGYAVPPPGDLRAWALPLLTI